MVTTKYKRETDKELPHTDVFSESGVFIGYITKNKNRFRTDGENYNFTPKLDCLPHFYESNKRKVLDTLNSILSGHKTTVTIRYNVTKDIELDMFEQYELIDKKVSDYLLELGDYDTTYDKCAKIVKKLNKMGWTCDYGLDGMLIDLKKL